MADLAKVPDIDIDMAEEAVEEQVGEMSVESTAAQEQKMEVVDAVEKPEETGLKYDKAELKKYLEEMRYAGFSEKLALKALEAEEVEGPESIDDGKSRIWYIVIIIF